jgi:hypothetical protein
MGQPKSGESVKDGQRQPLAKTVPKFGRIDRVLAVMSGKGGVGKSTVSALLAVALARAGHKVGILDADITGPSIPRLFGLDARVVALPQGGILPATDKTGIKVISVNLMLPREDDPVIWRGPLIAGTVKQFWEEVAWGGTGRAGGRSASRHRGRSPHGDAGDPFERGSGGFFPSGPGPYGGAQGHQHGQSSERAVAGPH